MGTKPNVEIQHLRTCDDDGPKRPIETQRLFVGEIPAPWLRADSDPRKSVQRPQDARVLNMYSRRLSDLVTEKAQLLTALKTLKHQHGDKNRITQLQKELRDIEEAISKDFECSKTLTQQVSITEDSAREHGFRLVTLHHTAPGYLFGGKPLAEAYTEYLDCTCSQCHQRIRRTKRAIDVGGGVKLFAPSCHCCSTMVNRLLSSPSQDVWGQLARKEGAQDA